MEAPNIDPNIAAEKPTKKQKNKKTKKQKTKMGFHTYKRR